MCTHISLTKSIEEVALHAQKMVQTPQIFTPYYHFNGWETKTLAVALQQAPEEINTATWGILPTGTPFANRTPFLAKTNTLNATKERLFTSPLYQQFVQYQRCLIFVDGFFEPYSAPGLSYKIPYYFKEPAHGIFAFAGLYAAIESGVSTPSYAATIITTEATPWMQSIHNTANRNGSYRMPLRVDPKNYNAWLQTTTTSSIKALLQTPSTQPLEAYPVTRSLFSNKKDTNVPSVLKEVPFQQSLF